MKRGLFFLFFLFMWGQKGALGLGLVPDMFKLNPPTPNSSSLFVLHWAPIVSPLNRAKEEGEKKVHYIKHLFPLAENPKQGFYSLGCYLLHPKDTPFVRLLSGGKNKIFRQWCCLLSLLFHGTDDLIIESSWELFETNLFFKFKRNIYASNTE